jgi:hypothetical protein
LDYADPFDFINLPFGPGGEAPGGFQGAGMEQRMLAAARLTGDARLRAAALVDHALAKRAAPAAPFASGTVTHFLSSRMGWQVLHPIYGLDLAALCVRRDVGAD